MFHPIFFLVLALASYFRSGCDASNSLNQPADSPVEDEFAFGDRLMELFKSDLLKQPQQSSHSNNWAVIVCASRFWFNYRHIANALSIYRTVKRLGIPDSNIILMLADDVACNTRNPFPGAVYNNRDRRLDLYGGVVHQDSTIGDNEIAVDGGIEVDYRGYEVTVETFIRLMTNRLDENVPNSKRLLTDDKSNILVYMTGHGGDEFLKFQDKEEISSHDIADVFQQMYEKRRYHEILFIIDTCQANTMFSQFYSPNIIAAGSSRKGENSYSHHVSSEVGVAVIDRFTYFLLEYMERKVTSVASNASLMDFFDNLDPRDLMSNHGVRTDLLQRDFATVKVTDFFGNVPVVEVTEDIIKLDISSATHLDDYVADILLDLDESPPVPKEPAPHDKLADFDLIEISERLTQLTKNMVVEIGNGIKYVKVKLNSHQPPLFSVRQLQTVATQSSNFFDTLPITIIIAFLIITNLL